MARHVFSILIAIAVTLGLVYFMTTLVGEPTAPAKPPEVEKAQAIPLPQPEKPKPEPQEPKPQPTPASTMPAMSLEVPEATGGPVVTAGTQVSLEPVALTLERPELGPMSLGQGEQDASPLVRIDPQYPPEAARDGVEGWVKLGYSVTEAGTVADIQVLDAEPRRTFDRAAVRALKKWRFQPKLVDGKPVSQPGQQVVLDFKLEKAE
ncbi:TonB family protein [Gallaecimonas sp. GXIMD4217]|uniref:energy transducer TonB n=1 Tax=Gallaecimonas sp. GXIMD4217 TaxID=3131927 RepID=UPI00311B0C6D